MEIYLKLFEVLFPVFFIIGIGFFLGKKNPNFDTSFITTYSGNFGTPALVIFALTAGGVTFQVFAEFFIYAIVLLTSFGFVGLVFLLLMKKDHIRELPTFFLPNTGCKIFLPIIKNLVKFPSSFSIFFFIISKL